MHPKDHQIQKKVLYLGKFFCQQDCNGKEIKPGEQFGDSMGHFLSWERCPEDSVITGLRAKVDDANVGLENTGLNKIEFRCSRVEDACIVKD